MQMYGPVQSVKHLNGPSDSSDASNNNASNNNNGGGNCYTVAFVDICSAAKAHKADHRIDDRILKTTYYEPSVASLSGGHYSSGGAAQSSGGSSVGSGVSHYPSGPSQAQGLSQTPLGSRSPRFATGIVL
ncbi:hypothetical protein HAZT_HAZT006324 [Hyalella azteca]|uniref:Uncharacterized protein n=1 Tax=Hyalella azteca TaxID=294128 RepID=A0A6A0H5U1_HYAAZ|nr:hypothetical protein HAZT_HAZT006324 [Hyalella azteca]